MLVAIDENTELKSIVDILFRAAVVSAIFYSVLAYVTTRSMIIAINEGRWPPSNFPVPFRTRIKPIKYSKVYWIMIVLSNLSLLGMASLGFWVWFHFKLLL